MTAPRGPQTPADSQLQLWKALALLCGLVVLAYANSFSTGWHFDDETNITDNSYIQMRSLGPSSLWRAMVQDRKQNRPFSNLSFALNYYFNGYQIRGYHLVNLGLHLLASLAAFLGLRFTFRRAGLPEDRRDPAALAAAALWAVHPIQTQAVTYIVQRQTLMASAFMLGAFLAYFAGREAQAQRRKYLLYGLATLSWIAAVGSKEIALVTPALVLIYEFYFFQNFSLDFLRRRRLALLLGLILISLFLAIYVRPAMWQELNAGYQLHSFTWGQRLLTEPRVLIQYLGLILWPLLSRLSLEHDPALSTSLFSPWTTCPALLLWALLLAAAIRYARRHPLLSLALLWYLGNLFLESSILPLDLMFEHRLYLPSLALIAPLAAAPFLYLPRRRWARFSIAVIALLFLLGTRARNEVWLTDFSLYKDCVYKAPRQARAFYNLGLMYSMKGDTHRALGLYSKALELNPNFADALINRGATYFKLDQPEPALADFNRALELSPKNAGGFLNRGFLRYAQGRNDLALADYAKALEFKPDQAEVYNYRAVIYKEQGQWELALADFNQALRLEPTAEAYFNRGVIYLKQGQLDRAILDFNLALGINPNYPKAYLNRGNAYSRQGQFDPAIANYSQALELNPNYAEAYLNRGNAYLAKGLKDQAQADLTKALELKPELFAQP